MLTIKKTSTMQEVLEAYPSAQRALFQKYHIGGCHSCGYEPTDVLEEVAKKHGIHDMDEVLGFIEEAERTDQLIQISPVKAAEAMKGEKAPILLDVRDKSEWECAHISGAKLMSENLAREIMSWPKDTPMIFYCHKGTRSMDAAAFFLGHGYSQVRSMTGGIDAWSLTVDKEVPRYEITREPSGGRLKIQPLRLVVSQAEGCMNS
jgi:rhodanese-related sulfurtransferase